MRLPKHVAVVMDGNRRWARQMGFDDPKTGHRYGAAHLHDLLGWCAEEGIDHVTVFVASADNMRKRDADEVEHLMLQIESIVAQRLSPKWRLRLAGRLDALPETTRAALVQARDATAEAPFHLTVAIGYDGRAEIVDAIRSLLLAEARAGTAIEEAARRVTPDAIEEYLYTAGLPDPDLVIRTSGEKRLSGFLLWQSTHSRLHFCDVYWPGFSKTDFQKALREYANAAA